MNKHNEN